MSVTIKINDVVKRFGDVTVIPGLTTEIKESEFFTLLGPSGCGKTTLLRMIAGFNSIEDGDIYFNDQRINDVDPAKRSIGMVFQNYAIFPHLSVRKNVEFGLKNIKFPRKDIHDRAQKYIDLVHVDKWADKMPDNLSGGQQQRVALARALVTSPDVLLMDEPLSNLDAKLRVEMREVIREIQQSVGITTVYVTHDQEEAMAVSDRIAVMKEGVIQQIGTPRELYHRPANTFVAGFIGRTNEVPGTLERIGDSLMLHLANQTIDLAQPFAQSLMTAKDEGVIASIRPEHLEITPEPTATSVPAVVEHSVYLGASIRYFLRLEDGTAIEAEQESDLDDSYADGAKVNVDIKINKVNLFSADGSTNLLTVAARGGEEN